MAERENNCSFGVESERTSNLVTAMSRNNHHVGVYICYIDVGSMR